MEVIGIILVLIIALMLIIRGVAYLVISSTFSSLQGTIIGFIFLGLGLYLGWYVFTNHISISMK